MNSRLAVRSDLPKFILTKITRGELFHILNRNLSY